MKNLIISTILFLGIILTTKAQSVSTANVKKTKNTGCYTSRSHSTPKKYEKKKFFLAEVLTARRNNRATENERKPMVSEPRNSHVNNEQGVIKSKYGVTSK